MRNKKVYNPSDKGKRKYVSSMRNRILAGLIAAVTAASPVMTSAAELGGYDIASETDGSIESLDVNTGGETAAETVADDSGTVSVTTEVGNNENTAESAESVNDVITKAEESESTGEKTETKFLFINLAKAKGGTVILNEGELDDAGKSAEKKVKLVTQTDTDELGNETTRTLINVYDKDDVLIDSEDAADNANIYVCEVKTDEVVTVKVVADDGYVISKYDLQDRLVDGVKTDVGFDKTEGDDLTVAEGEDKSSASDKTEFSYPVFMKDNMALTIEVEKAEVKNEADGNEVSAGNNGSAKAAGNVDKVENDSAATNDVADADLTVDNNKNSGAEDGSDTGSAADEVKDSELSISTDDKTVSSSDELIINDSAESEESIEKDATLIEDADTSDGMESVEDVSNENNMDDDNLSNIEKNNETTETVEDVTSDEEYIPEQNINNLNADDFLSKRIILMTDNDDIIVDKESHILGEYNNIYLLYYDTVTETMNAYQYYKDMAVAVEPDKVINTAAEEDILNDSDIDITSFEVSDSINPLTTLDSETSQFEPETLQNDKIIALIDTGVNESANVIDRVSLIDDDLAGTNDHGNKMVESIVSQDNNAKILSIRAMGNDGKGTVSSIVAAMEYAINQHADIINLSLYAKTDIVNSVLAAEIEKADEEGIMVVGAAGNDGADVENYMPGSVWQAIIIGACNEEGRRYPFSNYGDNVAYYVNAESTSEAAAKFSGYLYSHSYIDIEADNTLIFDKYDVEKRSVVNQIGVKSENTLKMYYLFHDGTKEDNDTMHIISSMIGYKDYEILDDGTISCKINPDPSIYDYNEEGMGKMNEIDVDINRGGHGTGDNKQIAITEECVYDEESGYLTIPAKYTGQDITVTVWQSNKTAFYKKMVPDEFKPEEDRTGEMTIATYAQDWPGGLNSWWEPMGCNIITLPSMENCKVGDVYEIACLQDKDHESSWYIGKGSDADQKDWSFVPGAEEYKEIGHAFGQIFHIDDCENKNFVNAGTLDTDGKLRWLFGACISQVNNNFPGKPHSISPSYIECIELNAAKTEGKFYLHVACAGEGGKQAQTMACTFKATVEGTSITFSKTLGLSKNFSNSTSRVRLKGVGNEPLFTIYSNYACTRVVKKIFVDKPGTSTKIVIKDLDPGTYYMKETGRCYGTKQNKRIYKFKLQQGKNTTKLSILKEGKNEAESATSTIKNVPFIFVGKLFAKYKSGTVDPIEGAIFKVEYSAEEDNTSTDADEFASNKWHRTWYFKSGTDGNVVYDADHYLASWNGNNSDKMFTWPRSDGSTTYCIPLGELRVQEVYAPAGCIMDSTRKTFKLVAPKDDNGEFTIQRMVIDYSGWSQAGVIYNTTPTPTPSPTPTPAPCQVYVTKHSTATAAVLAENEYSVGGAVFGVYSDAGCSQEIGRVTTGDNSVSNPLQLPCTSAGNYTYYVKELAAPAGHNLNTEVKSVNVSLPTDNGKWFNVDFWDAAKFSHIQIKKVAADGASWNDNLKGTEFSLYLGNTWLETISIQNADFHAFQYGCLLGKTYTVKETKVMPGKIKSPDFNVTIDNEANYQPTYWYTVTNKDVPKVKVTKNVSEGNDNELLQLGYYSRANAVFEVYADAALQNLVGTLSTDENGETGELSLPCQTDGTYTYYVKETKAPDGHKITDTVKPVTVTLPQDAGTTKGVEFTDEPDVAEIPDAAVQKLSSKGKPVEGVVFEVKLYDGTYNTANECPANMLKKTWYLKSDEDGLVKFESQNLAPGYNSDAFYKGPDKNGDGKPDIIIPKGCTLTMQEKKTPSTYVLDDSIMLWKTGETKTIEVKKFYNQVAPCKIKIRKLSDDGKPLQGVEFELKFVKESEPYTSDADKSYIPLLKQGEATKATTDVNGYIVWQNLDQGEYQITETKTISGNTLLKDPINITLPITMTDKQAKDMSAATDQGQFDEYTNKWYFYEATFEVTNSVKFIMPTTGANGVWRFIFFGFGTMAVLTTGLVVYDARNKRTRKRRRK